MTNVARGTAYGQAHNERSTLTPERKQGAMTTSTPTVTCSRCGTAVPQPQAYYSTTGQLLCGDCNGVHQIHAQIERSRQDELRKGGIGGGGLVGLVAHEIRKAAVHRQHDRMQADTDAFAASLDARGAANQPAAAETPCAVCGQVVAREQAVFSRSGQLLCPRCAAQHQVDDHDQRVRGNLALGFLAGFVLSVVGVVAAYAFGWGTDTKKGAWLGAAASGVIAVAAKFMMG
jgi:hypothetical protein